MEWARRVRQVQIRRLYRSARLGIYDEEMLEEVGSGLYARCADIAAVADAYRYGKVPCPGCGETVQRKVDAMFGLEGHGAGNDWFACPGCDGRLLWQDCRAAMRQTPRCFDCLEPLAGTKVLRCSCGKKWDRKAYQRSVGVRVLLPCTHCDAVIRKPKFDKSPPKTAHRPSSYDVPCPKCDATAQHTGGYIQCGGCGYKRRWRDYRRGLKRRDEKLTCKGCGHAFKWQAWRKEAGDLTTGNPQVARDFVAAWPRCRTAKARMMLIDGLLQTLHGRGPLAPYFIEGDEAGVRRLLDQLAVQV